MHTRQMSCALERASGLMGLSLSRWPLYATGEVLSGPPTEPLKGIAREEEFEEKKKGPDTGAVGESARLTDLANFDFFHSAVSQRLGLKVAAFKMLVDDPSLSWIKRSPKRHGPSCLLYSRFSFFD